MHQSALSTFVIFWMLLVMESNTQPMFSSCSGDMIFVMDASSSIWVVDFRRQLDFVANLADTFDIGPGPKQVGMSAITFSDHAHLDFPLDRFQSLTELKEAILKIPYRTGGTNTAEALKLLRNVLTPYVGLKRRPLIAVVITDGLSWDSALTKKEAEEVHRLGINMHAVGVGNHYDMGELKSIASDPVYGVHEVTSYAALKDIADKFRVRLCEVTTRKPTTLSTEPPTTISSMVTMTPTRNRVTENTPLVNTTEMSNKIFPTVKEALKNKPRMNMTSIPSKTELGGNDSVPPRNIAAEVSTTVNSKFTMTPTSTRIPENTPIPNTIEISNRIFTTTEAIPSMAAKGTLTNKPRMTIPSITYNSKNRENKSVSSENTTVLTSETSTKSDPKNTMTSTREQMTENTPTSSTSGILKRILTTAEATTLRTGNEALGNKSQMTTTSTSAKSEQGHNETVPDVLNRIFTTPETSVLTTVEETLANKSKTTTAASPFKSKLGQNDSVPPGNIAVSHETDFPRRDFASTVVFGFDLKSMGPSRSNAILHFINYILPYIGYGKFALISNDLCTQDFNIPLTFAKNEGITKDMKISLLRRLNQKKPPVLVEIIRQMNEELFKDAYFKNGKNPKRQIGVLFVDPSVSEITSEVLLEADEMKKNGIELFVISIGSVVWTDVEVFSGLSSQPHRDFLFAIPTYDNLPQMVKNLPLQFREISDE